LPSARSAADWTNPLAIGFAAARVRALSVLKVIAARLNDRFRLLTAAAE
jgi:predicted ATPase